MLLGGVINSAYSQYRDPSSKKKKNKKRPKGKPLFKRKQKPLKSGSSPFASKSQKSHRADINLSPFASKTRKKHQKKLKKRNKRQGQISDKKRAQKKPPKKTFRKKK